MNSDAHGCVYGYIHKRYLLGLTRNVFASLWVMDWASMSWAPAHAQFSVFNYCSEFPNLWIGDLQETLQKTLVQPLQPRGAQRASLGTVQRVAKWLALVISQFPSWTQSGPVIFLKISVTIILFHLGYDSGKLSFKAFRVISCLLPWLDNRISCYGPG